MLSRKVVWSPLLLAVLLLGVTTVSGWARECSLETLKGAYGIFVQGTLLVTSPQLPFVVSGIFTYDGAGNVSGTYTQSVGGGISTGTAAGTYQVNSDCTYSATLTTPVGVGHRAGTITGEGMQQEIHILYTDPISVAFGTLKPTPQGGCSLETLKGSYALFGQGTILPPGAPPILRATAGILTFDGAGNFSGEGACPILSEKLRTAVPVHLTPPPSEWRTSIH